MLKFFKKIVWFSIFFLPKFLSENLHFFHNKNNCSKFHVVAILSFGAHLQESLAAAEELTARGLSTTVADARFVKPLDEDLVRRLAREHEVLITIEEGAVGGFSAHVMQYLANSGMLDSGLKIRSMTLPDRFISLFSLSLCFSNLFSCWSS